ncbi:MAG: Fic family protein [Burkholderiales bacterium]|nr:Fic family protein [Burkholderiales bacterium]
MPEPAYIWQQPDWPELRYEAAQIGRAVGAARRAQGRVEGRLSAIGLAARRQLVAESWAQEALATAAIEGERLDLGAVRSSVCRRLGVDVARTSRVPRDVEGLLDVMEDAVEHAAEPLTDARLQAWQRALFPTGFSGLTPVRVNAYRAGRRPMQIVSGAVGRERVHYEAPPSRSVAAEMKRFLRWFNEGSESDPLVRAALAHLWFETIHPFEDGNGRVGRAIVDLTLARDSGEASRMVRISQQLSMHREGYYEQLQRAQHGGLDVTPWVAWFVAQVHEACETAASVVDLALAKARFWTTHAEKDLNARQRKVLQALLDAGPGGFEGGMNTRKYEAMTGTSRATSSRELIELTRLGFLVVVGGGRSTRYYVNLAGWAPVAEDPS